MIVRKPRFAGPFNFYPDSNKAIEEFIHTIENPNIQKSNALSIICPHAGYVYSAKTAIKVMERINIPGNIVLIGPNHTGEGSRIATMSEGGWEIPGSVIPINTDLTAVLIKESQFLKADPLAHNHEHSLEVLLPLLYYFNPDISIVPITMGDYSIPVVQDLTSALIKSIQSFSSNLLVVASSDMSHYVSRDVANRKDSLAFSAIRNLNGLALLKTVKENNISMCGSGPVAVSIDYAKQRGATKAMLIDYTDSGFITGDSLSVVSYAGFIVE